MPQVRRPRCLMDQDAIAKRNLNLSERIARVIGLNPFSRDDVAIFYPWTVRWDPFRIKNDLGCAAQTAGKRKLSPSYTDAVGPGLFSILPQRQLKRGDVYGN